MAETAKPYPGTDLKFKILFLDEDFNPAIHNWKVEFLNRYGQKVGETGREESLIDIEENFYITVRAEDGKIYAKTTYYPADGDFESGHSQQTDIQPLYDTGSECLPRLKPCWCEQETEHRVQFEAVNVKNAEGLYVLLDRDGEPILDRDGQPFLLHKFNEPQNEE